MKSTMAQPPRIAVLGAGVIGQVYAAALHRAEADVVLLARGERLARLQEHGVRNRCEDPGPREETVPVPVVDAHQPPPADLVLLAVRAQHLAPALRTVEAMGEPVVVTLMHVTDQQEALLRATGRDRLVVGFPGVGGFIDGSGTVVWAALRQQPTTVDAAAPACDRVRAALGATRLRTVAEARMPDWLNTHTVFIACLSTAILRAGGDPVRAGQDPRILHPMVEAVRDGFRAYRRRGGHVRPGALATLFGPAPAGLARWYWRRALQGPVGRITLAPHTLSSQHDEVPLICRRALDLGGSHATALRRWLEPVALEDD